MPLWRFFALVLLGAAGVAVLAIWVFPATGDFRWENPFWNGVEDVLREYDVTPLSSAGELPENAASSALVVIPYQKPASQEIALLRAYLDRGGTLILADDYGFGNALLEGLHTPARFIGAPLLDPLFNYRDSWFPLAIDIRPSPLTTRVSSLALNYGTALEGTGLTGVAYSSGFSYLDLNGDGTRDNGEPIGPFPVVAYGSVGSGRLILISDPSIFINSMLGAADNARFVSNLVGSVGPGARIFLHQTLLPVSNLTQAKSRLTRLRILAGHPGALAALTTSLAAALLYPLWRKWG